MSVVSLKEQAEEAELHALEYSDHVKTVRGLAAKGKRPAHEVEHKARRLVTILAVAKTMAALAKCADEIRPIIERNMRARDAG